ncbi:AT-hook motif nuclear-localized protein 10-like [Salvia splendens]|uniref:AT-hook motif nuclear-localized protein 10-like n=1 Tax=Salvia splendens TaxID=180675 RepID=UPI001C26E49C|nr:AT-hook motif nuclear-localized protein 10-like [Salvia splendens]
MSASFEPTPPAMANREPFSMSSPPSMANREQFSMSSPPSLVMNPATSQPQLDQQMHMSFMNSDGGAFRQVVGSSPPSFQSIPAGATLISLSSTEQKRKRGRPRKYGPDGSISAPLGSPNAVIPQHEQQQQQNFLSPAVAPQSTEGVPPGIDGSGSPTAKKSRGRPRGSRNKVKQHGQALGSTGISFVPHVLNVTAGEDIASKIMAICQNGPRGVCVLSANGTVSMVALVQQTSSGGTATFEGRFEILSLSGSFILTEVAGQKSRTGGLSVTLAHPDGSIMGGCVAGLLVAASPAQIIVGSFMPDIQRQAPTNYMEPSSAPRLNQGQVGAGGSSSPSRGTPSESSGGAASPLNLSSGAYNITQGMSGIPWK